MTTLARLVAGIREEATDRLHQTLFDLLTPAQRVILELTVEAEAGRGIRIWSGGAKTRRCRRASAVDTVPASHRRGLQR
ncbi:MAG: hypothetical protein ACJ72W_22250 [Actinoallomurus sp.]